MTGEFDLIDQLFRPMAGAAGLGLRDDAALFRPPPDMELVLTTDALVADVHFPANAPPDMIAARLVACNAADLAAKGAAPVGCLLTLGVAPDWDEAFLTGFAKALAKCLARFNMPLWGGIRCVRQPDLCHWQRMGLCQRAKWCAAPMRGQAMMFMLPAQSVTAFWLVGGDLQIAARFVGF